MAKLTLSNVTNISGAESVALGVINANSDAIETALENTLSRNGTSPNSMAADLDMDNNDILNVDNIDVNTITIDGVPVVVDSTLYATGSEAGVQGFRYDFNTVSLLLSDTTRTYSNTTAGDYIRTRSEGFAYEVAASGASDHHVTTGGGLKLYVLPDAAGEFNLFAFGAVGDAMTTSAAGLATISSGTSALTMTGTNFQSADVGKVIQVPGAGVAGATLFTTIAAVTSATQVTLANNASTSLAGAMTAVTYGTDNTNAVQKAMAAISSSTIVAAPENWSGIDGSYSGTYPCLNVPHGRYIVDTLNIPAYFRALGDNSAFISKAGNDIFYGDGSYQFFCDGINFVGGRHQIYLRNANIDKTMWKLSRFSLRMSSSYAVKTEATGGVWTHCSANLTLSNGIVENCAQFLDNCCDSAIVEDVWGQPNKSNYTSGMAWIRNRGDTGHPKLSLHGFFGVPVMGVAVEQSTTTANGSPNATLAAVNANIVAGMRITGTGIAGGTTVVSCVGTALVMSANATANGTNTLQFNNRPSCRWIDNYGSVYADQRTRFGGEDAGMSIINHLVAPKTAYPWDPYQIVLEGCDLNAGPAILADSGAVVLQGQMPNLISIRNCTGPISSPLITNVSALVNAAYFTAWETASGQSAFDYFKIDMKNNHTPANGGAIYGTLASVFLRQFLTSNQSAVLRRAATQSIPNGLGNQNIAFDTTDFNNFIPVATVPPTANITALPMPVSCTRMRISAGVTILGTGVADGNIIQLRITDAGGVTLPGGRSGGPVRATADGYYLQISTEVVGTQGATYRVAIAHNAAGNITLQEARVVLEPLDTIN